MAKLVTVAFTVSLVVAALFPAAYTLAAFA
jgi:hypothetical protein